jgi:hypothetical protein
METESIRLLKERLRELRGEIRELKNALLPLEAEVYQVELGLRAMEGSLIAPTGADASRNAVAHHARRANPDIEKLTLKQIIMKALAEHFADGATAIQMLDFFARQWGRQEMRTSLSPQLSRLKEEGKITLEGKIWRLAPEEDFEETLGLKPQNENGATEAAPDAGGVAAPSTDPTNLLNWRGTNACEGSRPAAVQSAGD